MVSSAVLILFGMHEWTAAHQTRPKDLPLVHVFDYVHVLKCLWNRLLNSVLPLQVV